VMEICMKHVRNAPEPPSARSGKAVSAGLEFKTMRLPSGAGHDAQVMARLGPMGMIFVPSVGGISHSPKELTLWPDCANGANVLLETVLQVDRLQLS